MTQSLVTSASLLAFRKASGEADDASTVEKGTLCRQADIYAFRLLSNISLTSVHIIHCLSFHSESVHVVV